jgi:amino acid transporter
LKLSYKFLLAAPILGILGVIFILLDQSHLYFTPGSEHVDRFFTLLSMCGVLFLLLAGATVLFTPFWLWKKEPPKRLALTGIFLVLGAILFALFAYEAFILDGITTVRDGNGILLFFAAPPASPALLSGLLTLIAAAVGSSRPRLRS